MEIVTAAKMNSHLVRKNYSIHDIIDAVVAQNNEPDHAVQTALLAKKLRGTTERDSLYNLFDFVCQNFTYEEDGDEKQLILSPSRLWVEKRADCKSFTLFITSVLQNWNIPFVIRFVRYKGQTEFSHVFPVAILQGKPVYLDTVYEKQYPKFLEKNGRFDEQTPNINLTRDIGDSSYLNLLYPNKKIGNYATSRNR